MSASQEPIASIDCTCRETFPPTPGRWVCEAGTCTEQGPAELPLLYGGERQYSMGFISVEVGGPSR